MTSTADGAKASGASGADKNSKRSAHVGLVVEGAAELRLKVRGLSFSLQKTYKKHSTTGCVKCSTTGGNSALVYLAAQALFFWYRKKKVQTIIKARERRRRDSGLGTPAKLDGRRHGTSGHREERP